jgi:hypothetical protein
MVVCLSVGVCVFCRLLVKGHSAIGPKKTITQPASLYASCLSGLHLGRGSMGLAMCRGDSQGKPEDCHCSRLDWSSFGTNWHCLDPPVAVFRRFHRH